MVQLDISGYNFNKDKGILYKKFKGAITFKDIESMWNEALKNDMVPEGTKRFVLDFTEANVDLPPQEYIRIPEFFQKHVNIFSFAKIAIVTENPRDHIIPILVESKEKGYYSKPFSTVLAANNWVV